MSTRANIIIKDKHSEQFFYRHSDGYPEGVLPTLNKFMEWLKAGIIRDNLSQACGWLVILGAIEYNTIPSFETTPPSSYDKGYGKPETIEQPNDWKVGAYEPCNGLTGWIEYLYIIDLELKELTAWEDWHETGLGKGTPIDLSAIKID